MGSFSERRLDHEQNPGVGRSRFSPDRLTCGFVTRLGRNKGPTPYTLSQSTFLHARRSGIGISNT